MTDDELLVLYRSMRTLGEGMEARNAALEKSTEELDVTLRQLRQLPAAIGQQVNLYIAAGVKESLKEDFRFPVEHAVKKPIADLTYAASEARVALGNIQSAIRFESYRYVAALIALGFVLGIGASYFFFNRQVDALNDRIDTLNERLLLVMPIPGAAPVQPEPPRKKHGLH